MCFAIPFVFGTAGYAGAGAYMGDDFAHVVTDSWHVLGFTVVLYLLVSFLVDEARRTASVAHAFARIAGVVANASSSSDALLLAEDDILMITKASGVLLLEPGESPDSDEQSDDMVVFRSTGRLLLFVGAPDAEHVATVGNLFQMLERRHLMVGQLHEESTTDPLTGLGNRRMLDDSVGLPGSSNTAVMLDLDHFKRYNDENGHRAGDDLLVGFAAVEDSDTLETAIGRADVALYEAKNRGRDQTSPALA